MYSQRSNIFSEVYPRIASIAKNQRVKCVFLDQMNRIAVTIKNFDLKIVTMDVICTQYLGNT